MKILYPPILSLVVVLIFSHCTPEELGPGDLYTPFLYEVNPGSEAMYYVSDMVISQEEIQHLPATEIRERVDYLQANPEHPGVFPSHINEGERNFGVYFESDEANVFVVEGLIKMADQNTPQSLNLNSFAVVGDGVDVTLCPDRFDTFFPDQRTSQVQFEVSSSLHGVHPATDSRELTLFGQQLPGDYSESQITIQIEGKLNSLSGKWEFSAPKIILAGRMPTS
ncbi:MAG: hypothetical protein AAGA10_21420 [Bacteroidota bacterium]